jgi:SAM-dependent methyltransferase
MGGSAGRQGQLWGRAARDWAYLMERHHQPLWQAALDALEVREGSRYLDAGCGGGGASLLARERRAAVAGVDASAALIEIAQQRVPDGDFRVGDLEDLPFDDATFDAVLAASSIQYATDPVAAVRELARVTAADGSVAVAVFATPDKVEYTAILDAVRATLPDPPTGRGPFALSTPGQLEELITTAGMRVTGQAEVACPLVFPTMDTFLRAAMSGGGVQAALEIVNPERLQSALTAAATPFLHPDGTIHFHTTFRYLTAVNPDENRAIDGAG